MRITVISLLQPFASLVVMGAKKIETRSWNTEFRGELYIHAGLGKGYGPEKLSCRELCYKEPFKDFINGGLAYDKLPFGKIIGKVNMLGTFAMNDCMFVSGVTKGETTWSFTNEELAFGNFICDWHGWLLSNPVQFAYPIQAKGKQGFWNYDLPDSFSYQTADGAHLSFPSPPTKEDIEATQQMMKLAKNLKKTPDWWDDLYTDGTGNTFSDADPGL